MPHPEAAETTRTHRLPAGLATHRNLPPRREEAWDLRGTLTLPPAGKSSSRRSGPGARGLAQARRLTRARGVSHPLLSRFLRHLCLSLAATLLVAPLLWTGLNSLQSNSTLGGRSWLPQESIAFDRGQITESDLQRARQIHQAPRTDAEAWLARGLRTRDLQDPGTLTTALNDIMFARRPDPGADAHDGTPVTAIGTRNRPSGASDRLGLTGGQPDAPENVDAWQPRNRLGGQPTLIRHPAFETAHASAPARRAVDQARRELQRLPWVDVFADQVRAAAAHGRAWQLHAALPDLFAAPSALRWHHFRIALLDSGLLRALGNSVVIAGWAAVLQTAVAALAGYGFGRLRWRGRDQCFGLFLLACCLPPLLPEMGLFRIAQWFDLFNSHAFLIVSSGGTALGTILVRQAMLRLPDHLEDAARLDGAGSGRVFAHIALPQVRPTLVAVGVLTFIGTYNTYQQPRVSIGIEEQLPVMPWLALWLRESDPQLPVILAAVLLAMAPAVLLFTVAHRWVLSGLSVRLDQAPPPMRQPGVGLQRA